MKDDGWRKHDGLGMPVARDVRVDLKFRDSVVIKNTRALLWSWGPYPENMSPIGVIVEWRLAR